MTLKDEVQQEFAYIRSTNWWEYVNTEIIREMDKSANILLSASDPKEIFRLQGKLKGLKTLQGILSMTTDNIKED